MGSTIVLVVHPFVRPGQEAAFREFETVATRIMRRYGGRIDRVIRPTIPAREGPLRREIHAVSFPSPGRFEAYREDQVLAKLAPLRQSTMTRTEVTIGEEREPYA